MPKFKKIKSFNNNLIGNMTLGLLQENGITCFLDDAQSISVDPLINPSNGGNLMVAEQDVERAMGLIEKAEQEYIKTIACPHCGSLSFVIDENTDVPKTLWDRLLNLVTHGQEIVTQISYRCDNCNSVYNELPSPIYN